MGREETIENVLEHLNPRLEELSDGYVEFLGFDTVKGELTIKTFGGRLL